MKIFRLLPFAAWMLAALPPLAAMQNALADRINHFVVAEQTRQKIPGVAVAVISQGKVVVASGYGLANIEHGAQVTAKTIFQSGSIGKQFTAAAVMLLVEDGHLGLDDTLAKFFPTAPAIWRDITVRHLLTHTSGIPDYSEDMIDYRRAYSEDDLVGFSRTQSPRSPSRA